MSEEKWWQTLEPDVEALARKIAARHGAVVDTLCLPFPPYEYVTGGGVAYMIDLESARPLWTFDVWLAREALEAAKSGGPLAPVKEEEGGDLPPTTVWKQGVGLDGAFIDE